MSASSKPVDWEAIEREYRAGVKPLRLLGEQYGISHTAIQKKAKREEWKRDLSHKVKQREDELVARAMVAKGATAETLVTEKRLVEGLATAKSTVRLSHQKHIARTLNIFQVMLGELEVTSNPEGQGLIEALSDALSEPDGETADEQKKRRESNRRLLDKVLDLPGRVDTMKKLTETLERLVKIEREAFGIKTDDPVDPNGNGPLLGEAERASRLASLFAMAKKRASADETTPAA